MIDMKKSSFLLAIGISLLLIGCNNPKDSQETSSKEASIMQKAPSVKELVDSREFLDIPYTKEQLLEERVSLTPEELTKLKAMAYRFYDHLELKDSVYRVGDLTASDLNISDDIFTAMKHNVDEVNAFIKENNKKGIPTSLPELDPESFLQGLD